jgi:ABC-2 type transport system permease protein
MTTDSTAILAAPSAAPTHRASPLGAFAALMLRDTRVLSRELFPFAVRVVMQPLLFLFVFTYLFPRMGSGSGIMMGGGNFATVLLPGLMAVAIMFTGIAAVALPLSTEFGITREIDDRVMCPLPVYAVAVEKVCFSALQCIFAALLVLPLAYYVPSTPVLLHVSSWPVFVLVLVLASLVSGALGLTIGASVQPRQIGLVFSIVVIPITFLGCVYYPWALLSHVRWLQIVVLANPIVYMSEGLRTSLTPGVPHMPVLAIFAGLVVSLALLSWVGIRNFIGRVIS